MNITQPASSTIESVGFHFLTPTEVKAISVKKIENPTTFDSLLNPTPGGLYDTDLGAWLEHVCSTCKLGKASCPGHAGHIELPVPVYHPIFMDQVMRLLRAQCLYCHRFKMRRADISLYKCKFRLLQYNLIQEANHLDEITLKPKKDKPKPGGVDRAVPVANVIDEDEQEDKGAAIDKVVAEREAYTEEALRRHRLGTADIRRGKHEATSEARRELVKEFLREMVKGRKCMTCDGISPNYRKDRFVKIFEKSLSVKDEAKMAQANLKRRDAIIIKQRAKKASKKKGRQTDEGIADIDMSSEGDVEMEEQDEEQEAGAEEGEGEELDENGDVVMTDATAKSTKDKPTNAPASKQKYVSASEVLARLSFLYEKEQEMISLLFNTKPQDKNPRPLTPESFFLQVILVPPNRFRPEARQGDGAIAESTQNSLYQKILESSARVVQLHREINEAAKSGLEWMGRRRDMSEFHEACVQLQDCVNSLIDRDRNPIRGAAAKRLEDGIKQKLEKKEGLFRKNMMGKRVNYAARSVISPDPNIETSEIGVPPVFARKLTYPEPVTSHNFREMQQAVINGPDKWPGAAMIEDENGHKTDLSRKSAEDRVALANQLLAPTNHNQNVVRGKRVYRHLGNGDVVLMNRQPTLHKPSIMGHRVRVLPGEKTIRMHYANCNTYNADFDGDEMNMHFPQNELARTEAMMIADTDHQYLSYTAGKPLRGLIQDHLSVSVALCNKDTLFDRGAYQQLVYNALRPEHGHITTERLELVPPAILKPVRRWTGKQVITTILKNIKPAGFGDLWLSQKTQIPANRWSNGSEEGVVLFQEGQFIHGILDKAHLGPASGGFIHSIHETWGPESAAKLLSAMGRLLTRYLAMRAFTCGMDDLRLTPEGEKKRKETLDAASKVGLEVSAKYVGLDENPNIKTTDPVLLERLESVFRNDSEQEGLEALLNKECNQVSGAVTSACLPSGLEKQFPNNQMQSMTTSGAKGSSVNANLISCNLGQQVLEGRRVPLMVSGKSLPCFRPFETNVRAGGYIVNRFLTGIRTQEYYFHHMAGREGLIDTAVKTSRSGYLQRCLIKGMEGLKVAYDTSVRDSDGSMIQFLYGEDGQDITKQKYLHDFGFVLRNLESEVTQLGFDDRGWDQDIFSSKEYAQKYMKKAVKEAKTNEKGARDPIITELNPNRNAFATSENFYEKVAEYIKGNKDGLLRDKGDKGKTSSGGISRKYAELVFHTKYLSSLAEPGEAVGIVAGQSIGEPSTQMTLNTFHLAGHSAKNVTLGIPRLREILMTASNHISTPAMTLVLNEELPEKAAQQFAKGISKLPLAHVTDQVTVEECVGKGIAYPLAKIFDVRLAFFRSSDYTETYAIEISDVLDAVENKFLPLLGRLIKKEIKARAGRDSAAVPDIGVKAGNVEMAAPSSGEGERRGEDDDEDDDDDGDGDATNARQREKRVEAVSYGPNDEDDDEIQRRMEPEDEDDGEEPEDEGFGGSPAPESDDEDNGLSNKKPKPTIATARGERVVGNMEAISRFECDEAAGEWCHFTMEFDANTPKVLMLNLVRTAVKKTLIQQIGGVEECTYVSDETITDLRTGQEIKTAVVHTKGVNLYAMQKYGDYINPNRTQTNDIAAVLAVYGVEAARRNIMLELNNVFKSHSISVDNRHLNLIADYMTRNGGFTPFNRMGLTGNVSPFTKMSFETTLSFLKDAVLDGDWDDLNTPSSRIVLGRVGTVGTGAFDVLTRVRPKNGRHQFA